MRIYSEFDPRDFINARTEKQRAWLIFVGMEVDREQTICFVESVLWVSWRRAPCAPECRPEATRQPQLWEFVVTLLFGQASLYWTKISITLSKSVYEPSENPLCGKPIPRAGQRRGADRTPVEEVQYRKQRIRAVDSNPFHVGSDPRAFGGVNAVLDWFLRGWRWNWEIVWPWADNSLCGKLESVLVTVIEPSRTMSHYF